MSYPNNSFIKTATVYYSKKSSEFQVYFKMKDKSTVKKTCKDGKLAELYPGSFLAYTQAEIIEVILKSEILLYYLNSRSQMELTNARRKMLNQSSSSNHDSNLRELMSSFKLVDQLTPVWTWSIHWLLTWLINTLNTDITTE